MDTSKDTPETKIARLILENDRLIEQSKKLEDALEVAHMRCEKLLERIDRLQRKNMIGYD